MSEAERVPSDSPGEGSGSTGAESVDPSRPEQGMGPDGVAAGANRLRSGLFGTPTGLLLALACATIVLYGMRHARGILGPIFLALFIVMGLSPILQWLRSKGLPPWAGIVIVLGGFVVIALLFLAIMTASLGQLSSTLPVYQENLSRMVSDVQIWFAGHGIDVSGLTSNVLNPVRIMSWVASSLRMFISLATNAALIILIVAFMIAEAYSFPRKAQHRLSISPRLAETFGNFGNVTRTFLFTLTWLNALTAVIVFVVYAAFRVDFAVLWALVFFLLSFIPNIGFVLSVIPPFFVTLLKFGFTRAAVVVLVIIVFNAFVNNAIAPRYMGQRTGLSALAVFLSLVIWAWVLGPIGALMSVPLMLMVKLLFFDSYESTRALSEFISPAALGVERPKKFKLPRWPK